MQVPLDHPDRLALWPKLAPLYRMLGRPLDAAYCYLNALWHMDAPSARRVLWSWGWLQAEAQGSGRPVTPADAERLLALTRPADVRGLAAYVFWTTQQESPPAALVDNFSWIRQALEDHEDLLPVRSAWLVWVSLARLARGDVLLLARARDRLLERLLHQGLTGSQDLPGFIRLGGHGPQGRLKRVRDWLGQMPDLVHPWVMKLHQERLEREAARRPDGLLPLAQPAVTATYANLAIAWGLARLGETGASRQLLLRGQRVLGSLDPVHRFLLEAYDQRIHQAADGHADPGPLTPLLLDRLERMDPVRERYRIDWFRQHSRILEPLTRINPYRDQARVGHVDDLEKTLNALLEVKDREALAGKLRQLLQQGEPGELLGNDLPRILATGLDLAPHLGNKFAEHLLELLPRVLDGAVDNLIRATLLEKGLILAGHFDMTEMVQDFVERFRLLLDQPAGPDAAPVAELLAGPCFRWLRKLGLRDAIQGLLARLTDRFLPGDNLEKLRQLPVGKRVHTLRVLLAVAESWFYFDREEQANAVLDEARAVLFEAKLKPKEQTALACAYIGSLGQAPLGTALRRLDDLFRRLELIHDPPSATNSHFALSQLDVVETVVRTVVNEDFTLGPAVRRLLDEDEYLIRRRIHRDLRTLMHRWSEPEA
jgi:hypothetical protein